jgi:hypothetical protein
MGRFIPLGQLQQVTGINLLGDPGAIGGPKVISSVAEIILYFALAGARTGKVVMHGRYVGVFNGSVAQANAILAALNTGSAAAAFLSHLAATTSLANVSIRDLGTANQGLIVSTGTGTPGTGVGNAVPNEMAVVVTKHTALTGRANRGRMYMPGWTTASVAADNTVVPTAVTDLQTWANTVQGALNASNYIMVIAHPARQAYTGTTGTPHPARAAGSVDVTSLFVRDNHWDSQRRRGLK